MSDILSTIVAYIILIVKFAVTIAVEIAIFLVFGRWMMLLKLILGFIFHKE